MTCKDHQGPLFDGPSCGARPCFAACPPELQQALQAQAIQTPHILRILRYLYRFCTVIWWILMIFDMYIPRLIVCGRSLSATTIFLVWSWFRCNPSGLLSCAVSQVQLAALRKMFEDAGRRLSVDWASTEHWVLTPIIHPHSMLDVPVTRTGVPARFLIGSMIHIHFWILLVHHDTNKFHDLNL